MRRLKRLMENVFEDESIQQQEHEIDFYQLRPPQENDSL
jgi:hypothetical protein